MKIMEKADLEFRGGGSDKVYHAVLKEVEGGHIVEFAFGRRGTTLNYGTKTQSPVSLDGAKKIFKKLVMEKTGKGYVPMPGAGNVFPGSTSGTASSVVESAVKAAKEKQSTGVYPQLLNPIQEEEVALLIEDPKWGAQEKKDGKRILARFDGKNLTGINRNSFPVTLPPVMADSFTKIDRRMIIDGEAIGDTLHAFGLLELNGKDLRGLSYLDSYSMLCKVLQGYTGDGIEIVPLARTASEKKELYERLKTEGKEGIVFKKLDAPYSPNRPNSGGDHLKFKFFESASFIVLSVNDKRSVKLGVYQENGKTSPEFVGNVTIPANYDIPKKRDVVEVSYLYAYKGGSLFQPCYLGVRDDINPEDCVVEQLKYKIEEPDTEQAHTCSARRR